MTLLEGARIRSLDAQRPRAAALLFGPRGIIALGDEGDFASLALRGLRRWNARGAVIWPALTDSHGHLVDWALGLDRIELAGCADAQTVARLVAQRASRTPQGQWIEGAGWDCNHWPGAALPDRRLLDQATRAHPVALASRDYHSLWVNGEALRRAGIDERLADPPGGRILRDAAGLPSGILLERATDIIDAAIGPPDAERGAAALAAALPRLHERGLLGVHSMERRHGWAALQELERRGELKLRVAAALPQDALDEALSLGLRSGHGSDHLWLTGLKIFLDGALTSGTAWMVEDYDDAPGARGLPLLAENELRELVARAAAGGLASLVHAIGDRAVSVALDAVESLPREIRGPALRHRIEHAQLIRAHDIPRFARLGVIASLQPVHLSGDRDTADRRWGRRGAQAFPLADLQAAGARFCLGSDFPIETFDPIAGLALAVGRGRLGNYAALPWHAAQRVDLATALAGYTTEAAYAAGRESRLGALAPGRVADFLVLSNDPFELPLTEWPGIRIRTAVLDGAVVFGEALN